MTDVSPDVPKSHHVRSNRHFSAEILARYAEGDLRQRKLIRVSAHLGTCSVCQGVSAELTHVSITLANVQTPPMPESLNTRIEFALAAESSTRIASQPASAEASRRDLPVRSARPRRRMPRMRSSFGLRLAAGAAAAVLVAGVSYEAVDHLGKSANRGASSAATAPGRRQNLGVEYGLPVTYHRHGVLSRIQPIQTSTNFVPAQLTSQVRQVMNQRTAAAPKMTNGYAPAFSTNTGSSAQATPTEHPSTTVNGTAITPLPAGPLHLATCLARIAAGNLVILVDIATYRAKPAVIIVTEASGAAKFGVAWVVGVGCSARGLDVLHHIRINF
jgi:hypothetical protein